MAGAETLNPIFTEFTTAKLVWIAVIVACTAFVVMRGQRRRRREAEEARRAAERGGENRGG